MSLVNPLNVVAKLMKAYSPLRKNDTDKRNESHYDMVTTYAPALKKFVLNGIKKEVKGEISDVHFLKTHYLHYRDDEKNNNKFHYYALVMFELDGSTNYVGANVYGRVGFGEKYQNLTKGFVENPREAENAINKHLYSKLNKGYKEVKLRRGSNKTASSRKSKAFNPDNESCKKLLEYASTADYIGKETGVRMWLSVPVSSGQIYAPQISIVYTKENLNKPIVGEDALTELQKCGKEFLEILAKSVVITREANKLFDEITEKVEPSSNLYNIGDVYSGTWGYSMILAQFAVIIGLTPKSIKFQLVGKKTVGGDSFRPNVVPDLNKKEKVVMVRMPQNPKWGVRVNDCYMTKWDGKPIKEDHLD